MNSRSPRVLLVDDQPDLRKLEELILREASYQVVVASATADPVSEAERAYPDVIVLGIRPYKPAVWESIDQLRAHHSLCAVPVVVISTAEKVVAQAHAAPNVRAALAAPYDVGALQEAVARALGNPPLSALLPPPTHPVPSEVVVGTDVLLRGARVIVLHTIERLRREEPYASRFSTLSVALMDDLPAIFGAIVTAMQRDLSPATLVALPAMSQAISQHARLREKQGVSPSVSIHEYQALRDQSVEFLNDQRARDGSPARNVIEIGRRFDQFIAAVARGATGQPGDRSAPDSCQPPVPVTP